MKRRFTIRFTVIGLFLLTTALTAGVAIALQYYFSKQQVLKYTLQEYKSTAQSIANNVNQIDDYFSNATELISQVGPSLANLKQADLTRDLFVSMMRASPFFYSAYVGKPNGDFYQVINLESLPDLRQKLGAATTDRWIVAQINPNSQLRTVTYYDQDMAMTGQRQQPSRYLANQRPWYIGAQNGQLYKTQPYLFQVVPVSGQTYAKVIAGTEAVVGVDIVLGSMASDIANDLGNALHNQGVEFYIYDQSGNIKAASDLDSLQSLPEVRPLSLPQEMQDFVDSSGKIRISNENNWPPLDFALRGQPSGYMVDLIKILSLKIGLDITFINGFSWSELMNAFEQRQLDVLHPLANNSVSRQLGALSKPLASFDFALAQLGNQYSALSQMQGKRLGLLGGWSIIDDIRGSFPTIELVEYSDIYQALLSLERGGVDAVLDLEVILHRVQQQHFMHDVDVINMALPKGLASSQSFHLAVSQDNEILLKLFNLALENLTSQERAFLTSKWLDKDSHLGVVPHKILLDATGDDSLQNTLLEKTFDGEKHFVFVAELDLFESGREFFAISVPSASLLKSTQTSVITSMSASSAILVLLIPLSGIFARPIVRPIRDLIEQMNRVRERDYKQVQVVESMIVEINSLSHSITLTSDALQEHERTQEEFIESFIKVIAQAIDDKSPYTAGHCNRVPELALMLVKEAEQSQSGELASFRFDNHKQRREFRIAAWLHDCGKITTPEHIVDKGSKLECNYNRIHEIRTRFEVMIRDQIIDFYQHNNPQLQPESDAALQADIEQLKQEFAEVAKANVGGEFMDDESVEKIERIAKRTWVRYLDDRLGLSPEEQRRLEIMEIASTAPAVESLLSDKPEHIYQHPCKVEFDPSFEIKMPVPEYLANRGEIYNLTIRKGTLTSEDRFKINEHIVGTIKMLEQMPFPAELAKVPRYASTHHETMKGTGYPRQLKGEQLSIPERIMVLADIFEALTAADRPYKQAKTLSEALRIMRFMVLDEHIDKEVYQLFLESKVYLSYAEQYLNREQIDEVDIEDFRV
ncbi:HD domain-containing phosphohydrolase [Vibrio gallicus]|uniref:HD domain-containing phosphohydrolase n=1 Tax=Vibrio gallicus TaxID=190897 RepID=UPI0021C468F2|nr:HD domain-containing phosphohydrolase [Vibrio gallicus]